jgi:TPR repeat protein
MEDNSGKKFSLQDWVMKRAANQSGAVMSSQATKHSVFDAVAESETEVHEVETKIEVEMKSVSNGSSIPSSAYATPPKPAHVPLAPPLDLNQNDEQKQSAEYKDVAAGLTGTQNPLQQLQIVRLLTDLGDRLRQSEKEREILWKEVETCRKQIADMNGKAGKSETSFAQLEEQVNQREVFVKELVEKQINLELQLKDQMTSLETARQEQSKLQDKIQEKMTSVETATGSAIVRVEDAIAENSKLSKRVEQLGQDKARLLRKLETVEETLAQTQETLKAKALVLLTDHNLAQRSNLPQTPAWTGDDTVKLSAKARVASEGPVSSITQSLSTPPVTQPNLLLVSVLTAIIAAAAAYGVILVIEKFKNNEVNKQINSEAIGSADLDNLMKPAALSQEELMAQAATIANQIEPSSVNSDIDSLKEDSRYAQSPSIVAAEKAQEKALENFKNARPLGDLKNLIQADKSLPAPVKRIEEEAFKGNAVAQHDLAAIYTAGHNGVPVDYSRALKWFTESAHNGSVNAQYNLGVLYHQGLGVPKDTAKAIELYRVAASNKHPEALYNLAIAYVEGVGVEYNPQIASVYLEQAASGGIVEAAYNLGLLNDNGLLGESQPDEAIFWYKIAADKGNTDAQNALTELKDKLIMSDADVQRITQKIAAQKPVFLNKDGQAELPDQLKMSLKNNKEEETDVVYDSASTADMIKTKVKSAPKVDAVIVSQIQEQLIRLGFYRGTPDGTVSPVLSQAIKEYQINSGLKADGKPSDDLLVQMLASNTNSVRSSQN